MRALLLCVALSVGCIAGASRDDDDGARATSSQRVKAPSWLLAVKGAGTWTEETKSGPVLRGWADARVANVRFHKRVLAEVVAPYEGGATITTLHPAIYKGTLDGGERWGTDAIELHEVGPNGAKLAGDVHLRFRFQHDLDNDGNDEMVETEWVRLFGSRGTPPPSSDPWAPGLTSPVRASGPATAPEIRFSPFDDTGGMVLREIDAVIAAKKADPAGRHTVHAAIFNINDARIVEKLIAAHRAGVEVRLITDAKKLNPRATWMTGDDALLAAGVPLLGVGYGGRAAMHLKVALFDGKKVATGSANWEWGSSFENHESMILSDDPSLVAAYAQRFEKLAGSVVSARVGSKDVTFGPDEQPYRKILPLLQNAQKSIHVAMFTAKEFRWNEGGRSVSLFDELIAAKKRGLDVVLVTDEGVAEGSEYHGVTTEDDPTDERLEAAGVTVVRADVPFARYASMHHKHLVIDGQITVAGAFNWYWDAAFLNDEDIVVFRDPAIAAKFDGEIAELCRRYDPAFDPSRWPQVKITLEAEHAATSWGDAVLAIGEATELGAWTPAKGLFLDGSAWPKWRGTFVLPAGARVKWKLATRRADGSIVWETGADRLLRVSTGTTTQTVKATFAR